MRSWQSWAFEKALLFSGRRKKFLSEEGINAFITLKEQEEKYKLDLRFMNKHYIKKRTIHQMDYYILNGDSNHETTIVYFHGGAYINEPLKFHWRFLIKLAEQTNMRILVPIYPKLPHNTYLECYDKLNHFYKRVLYPLTNSYIFMGDSAGGGLAMSFSQYLSNKGYPAAKKLILFAPWLDLVADDPQYHDIEKRDPMLGIIGGKKIAHLWSHGELTNYLVSPLYGPLDQLPQTTIFVGTSDLLVVDARKFRDYALEQNVDLLYFEYPKMNHVFPVFPIPEAKQVMEKIVPILLA